MTFPNFFRAAPVISVRDPLMAFLGTGDGIVQYGYADVVKLAGHSCPTVAGAFLMVRAGLAALYDADIPERGGVRLRFPDAASEGVTGVMAAVAGLVTGARGDDGFKGLAGRFSRAGLLDFGAEVGGTMAIERLDDGRRAEVTYDPSVVPPAPAMRMLLDKVLSGTGSDDDRQAFGALWQERVRRIVVDHADDERMVSVRLS
ncbi:MAG: hypothetical protein AB1918_15805 [Pseudomonadota bacterium]